MWNNSDWFEKILLTLIALLSISAVCFAGIATYYFFKS